MKKFVFAILIISSIMCALTNCSQPIGTLEHSFSDEVDSIFLVPRRQLYQLDEKFIRDEDFQLFAVDGGMVLEILPPFTEANRVYVELSGHIGLSTEFHQKLYGKENTHHPFYVIGRHIVTVTYGGKSSWYSIEVFAPTNGNTLGGDDGIGIIWLD